MPAWFRDELDDRLKELGPSSVQDFPPGSTEDPRAQPFNIQQSQSVADTLRAVLQPNAELNEELIRQVAGVISRLDAAARVHKES
eukprot:9721007-Karenia_brevis.AAC.1